MHRCYYCPMKFPAMWAFRVLDADDDSSEDSTEEGGRTNEQAE
jgi:hypothetical protein